MPYCQFVKVKHTFKIVIANIVLQDFKKVWSCAMLKYNWFVVDKVFVENISLTRGLFNYCLICLYQQQTILETVSMDHVITMDGECMFCVHASTGTTTTLNLNHCPISISGLEVRVFQSSIKFCLLMGPRLTFMEYTTQVNHCQRGTVLKQSNRSTE